MVMALRFHTLPPTFSLGGGPMKAIPVTGVSNGMAGGADLILQGNRSLQTARRGSTPCRGDLPCQWYLGGRGGSGGGGPM